MLNKDAIARFRELHERYKLDGVIPAEGSLYAVLRDELCSAVLRSQRVGLQPGQKARQMVRVAVARKILLTVADSPVNTMTCDLGLGGFAAFVNSDLPVGSPCEFELTTGGQTLRGLARVVGCVRHVSGGATHRASFALETMNSDNRARLEVAVLDAALSALEM
jgi:hypothetical protein